MALTDRHLFSANTGSNNAQFSFLNDLRLRFYAGGSTYVYTEATFRDPSAWYHVVLSVDTTAATSADRVKIYVNGILQIASASAYPSLNADLPFNQAVEHNIARYWSGIEYFDGYLADIHFIDGQALTPSSFGEFDTNGVWQPIDASGLTFGTNGFHLPFSNNSTAAALGTDTSGNGNDWTVNNIASTGGNGNYASGITIGNFTLTDYNKNDVVDGNLSTFYADRPKNGNGLNFSSIPQAQTSVRINYWTESGTVSTNAGTLSTGANAQAWRTISTTYPFTLTSFSVTGGSGGNGFFIYAIEVDGVVLVDNIFGSNNDSLVDSPTNGSQVDTGVGGEVVGNYATLNPLCTPAYFGRGTPSNGNLEFSDASSGRGVASNFAMRSGKWYAEVVFAVQYNSSPDMYPLCGICRSDYLPSSIALFPGYDASGIGFDWSGQLRNQGTRTAPFASFTTTDIGMIAYDADTGKVWFGKNGTWFNSGSPSTGANPAATAAWYASGAYFAANSAGGTSTASVWNFGQRPFAYTAPSGFKALCTTNLPEPTIADGSTVMDVALYTGNGSTQTISDLGFGPDLVWIKRRDGGNAHRLFDAVRGAQKHLTSAGTDAESTAATSLDAFNSDGFTLGANTDGQTNVNISGGSYVAWTWDAGSSTVTNTAGSITSQVRANASAGFSIVTYTGNGTAGATIGHGLGVAPEMIIVKCRNVARNWTVGHQGIASDPWTDYLTLNSTAAAGDLNTVWNDTAPSSTVFTVGTANGLNANTETHVAYCFAPVAGYSAYGSYTGNGSADGPFVYTGFRPKWVMFKRTDTTGYWMMYDSARSPYNAVVNDLNANTSDAEASTGGPVDFVSNGFKQRNTSTYWNASGGTYIYIAFAENPFQYARAR
jgi:hypothetical protein